MLGQRIVEPVGLGVVDVVHCQPDAVQVHGGGKVAQQGHDLDHLGRVGGHLGQLGRGFQLRRRGEIESQRDVLRDVALSAGHAVLGDVEAELVALGAGVLALGERQVHLVADPLADRGALLEALVVAAGIQRRGHEEDRLGADQRDGGTGGIDQRRRLFLHKIRRGRRSSAPLRTSWRSCCWRIGRVPRQAQGLPAGKEQRPIERRKMEML